jgi:hypothetical protein
MSIEAMDWAKQQKCGSPSVKAVLMEIANWTNPEGRAEFRVVRDIARVVEMSERNVQRIISKLETSREEGGLGLLRRVPIYGESGVQRANGFVLVGFSGRVTTCHPISRKKRKGEGDTSSPTGATNCHREGDTHVTGEGDAGVTPYQDHDLDKDSSPPTPRRGAERVRQPSSIPVDWACPAITALPSEIAALAAQWPQGAYQAEGAAFAQYWRGNGRRRADWNAQWAARVQARHAAVIRDAKAGVSFGGGGNVAEAALQAAEPVGAQRREDERSAELRAMLEAAIDPAEYATWFTPVALLFEDCGLVVVTRSSFWAAEIEKRHRKAIEDALSGLGRGVDFMRFVSERTTAHGATSGKGRRRG